MQSYAVESVQTTSDLTNVLLEFVFQFINFHLQITHQLFGRRLLSCVFVLLTDVVQSPLLLFHLFVDPSRPFIDVVTTVALLVNPAQKLLFFGDGMV